MPQRDTSEAIKQALNFINAKSQGTISACMFQRGLNYFYRRNQSKESQPTNLNLQIYLTC